MFKKIFIHSPIRYIIALAIAIIFSLVYLIINGFNYKIFYLDAFTVAGSIDILVGLLALVTYFGAFDTFGYAFSTFKKDRRYKDLVEYTDAKKVKRANSQFIFVPYVVVGVIFVLVGLIFLI